MTTSDRDETVALYKSALERFRAANRAIDARVNANSTTTAGERKAAADAHQRMLELRRILWPDWTHS